MKYLLVYYGMKGNVKIGKDNKKGVCKKLNKVVQITIKTEMLYNGNGPDKEIRRKFCSLETSCPYWIECLKNK